MTASRGLGGALLAALALAAGCGAPPEDNDDGLRAVWVQRPSESLLAADARHIWIAQLEDHDGPLTGEGPPFVLRLMRRNVPAQDGELSCGTSVCEQSARLEPAAFAALMPLGRYDVTACIMAGPDSPFGCAPDVAVEVVELGVQPLLPDEELVTGRAFTASGVLTANDVPLDEPLLAESAVVRFWSTSGELDETEVFPCAIPTAPQRTCTGLTSDQADNHVRIWPVRLAEAGHHHLRTCLLRQSEEACRTGSFVELEVLAANRALRFARQPAGAADGVPLSQQPLVEVIDGAGDPVAADGTAITLRPHHEALRMHLVAGEEATVAGSVATFTDVAVGPIASEVVLVAQAPGAADAISNPFDVTGTLPTFLALVAGDGGSAPVGSVVVFSVRVLDASLQPVDTVTVHLAITGGGGSCDPTTTTDAAGVGYGVWTLGRIAGANILEASLAVPGVPPLVLHVTGLALAGAQARKVLGDLQTAAVSTPLALRPTVLVTDPYGNPVQGQNVRFEVSAGGGEIDPSGEVDCDADGLASVSWTLGPTLGANTLTATALLPTYDIVLEFSAEAVP